MNELERLCRAEWGRLLSALIQALGDFDAAEEALQEACAVALVEWARELPRNPRAWLYGTARHKALDQMRRRALLAKKSEELALLAHWEASDEPLELEQAVIPDERLRLIFTCCHPALALEAQVALTLRTLCGLATEEIARAFLLEPSTLAQRLVRAKNKIRKAGIAYELPAAGDLPERLAAVMAVIYLVFNEGYSATRGDELLRTQLAQEAIRLARELRELLPSPVAELDALLSLMLLHDARSAARADARGELVLLAEQDRSLWNRAQIAEACALLRASLARALPGTYALEAAIAALHAEAERAEDTDWAQIAELYGRLLELHPSAVVALNRAAAVSMAYGPERALPLVDELAQELAGYHLWHAARADLLRRLERRVEALESYRRAHALAQNGPERRFLARRIAELLD